MHVDYRLVKLGEEDATTVHWLVQDSVWVFSHRVGFEPSPLPLSCCLHTWTLPPWCVVWAGRFYT